MIPNWTANGILPPVAEEKGSSIDRSPYNCTMIEVIERYATSSERINILLGVLNYRAELYKAGIETGFQWLDGSFTEDIEVLEERSPNDADIVTFFDIPNQLSEEQLVSKYPVLFDRENIKKDFLVDSYYITLNAMLDSYQVKKVTYWYSMWSHRRDGIWKGYLEIPLNEKNDIIARDLLVSSMGDMT